MDGDRRWGTAIPPDARRARTSEAHLVAGHACAQQLLVCDRVYDPASWRQHHSPAGDAIHASDDLPPGPCGHPARRQHVRGDPRYVWRRLRHRLAAGDRRAQRQHARQNWAPSALYRDRRDWRRDLPHDHGGRHLVLDAARCLHVLPDGVEHGPGAVPGDVAGPGSRGSTRRGVRLLRRDEHDRHDLRLRGGRRHPDSDRPPEDRDPDAAAGRCYRRGPCVLWCS